MSSSAGTATLSSREKRVYAFLAGCPAQTGNQDQLMKKLKLTSQECLELVNGLIAKSLVTLSTAQGVAHFTAVSMSEASTVGSLDVTERIIFQMIRESANEGIWTKTLKAKANVHQTVLNRCLKSLEAKRLIKSVKNVKFPTRKIYMLFGLSPSVELSGGPWYTDNELDTAFIDQLFMLLHSFIESETWPSPPESQKPSAAEDARGWATTAPGERPMYPASRTASLPTAPRCLAWLQGTGVLQDVRLDNEHVETLLDVLVYDGRIEKIPRYFGYGGPSFLPAAASSSTGRGGRGRDEWRAEGRREGYETEESESVVGSGSEGSGQRSGRRSRSRSASKRASKKAKRSRSDEEDTSDSGSSSSAHHRTSSSRGSRKQRSRSHSRSRSRSGSAPRASTSSSSRRRAGEFRGLKHEHTTDDEGEDRKRGRDKHDEDEETHSGSGSDTERDVHGKGRRREQGKRTRDAEQRRRRKRSRSARDDRTDSGSGSASDDDDEEGGHRGGRRGASAGASSAAVDVGGFVYRALRRAHYHAGWTEVPCGHCPVFDFCSASGPVNPAGCEYLDRWIEAGGEGGGQAKGEGSGEEAGGEGSGGEEDEEDEAGGGGDDADGRRGEDDGADEGTAGARAAAKAANGRPPRRTEVEYEGGGK